MIIHAVGPIWGEGNEDQKLHDAITGSLDLAKKQNLVSISFPAISTGIYGFPKERAARIILKSQIIWCQHHGNEEQTLRLIRNVLLNEEIAQLFTSTFISLNR
jgi:O-acetyl-ADP-ribose deacetylase (regulator of RNase III)